jgi:hypothetical protein
VHPSHDLISTGASRKEGEEANALGNDPSKKQPLDGYNQRGKVAEDNAMPIHDWSTVDANLFHDFHQTWTINIRHALNSGLLPKGYSALVEQRTGEDISANRGNRVTIRHRLGRVVCVIEIVSPGNKGSRSALRSFVEKAVEFLRQGVHLLIVDLFPPSARDPQGIHKAIWDEIEDKPFELSPDKPLTLAAYVAGIPKVAYVEPVGVGDVLPDMPAYLDLDSYVPVPLEPTYQATWASCPEDMREAVERGEPLSDEPGPNTGDQ